MKFTKEYFYEEIHRFRKLMTNIDSLLDAEKMDAAIKGLTYVYFNVELVKDDIEIVAAIFDSTIQEYSYRSSMMKFAKLSS